MFGVLYKGNIRNNDRKALPRTTSDAVRCSSLGAQSRCNLLRDCLQMYRSIRPPWWPKGLVGHKWAPPDSPRCGFYSELCKSDKGKRASSDNLRNRIPIGGGCVYFFKSKN